MNISIGFSYCQNSDGKCDLPKYHDIELRAPNGLEESGGKLVLAVKDTCKRVLSGAPSPQDLEKLGEKIIRIRWRVGRSTAATPSVS